MHRCLALSVLILCFTLPSTADARRARLSQVPNLPNISNTCNTCHTSGGGTARNAFGLDVQRTLVGGVVNWSAICGLDSDGDGTSNGAELGDRGCSWRIGDPSPPGPVFNPADASSRPTTDAGVPDTGPRPDLGIPMDSGPFLDTGPAMDAGPAMDSGTDLGPAMDGATPDMGSTMPDATTPPDAAASTDTGNTPDTGVAPSLDAGASAPDAHPAERRW